MKKITRNFNLITSSTIIITSKSNVVAKNLRWRNSTTSSSCCGGGGFLLINNYEELRIDSPSKSYYSYGGNNFRKILDTIDDKSKLFARKLEEYKYELKNIFFNSWDDKEFKNNYLRSKSDQLSEARSATDLTNIRDFEPLFEKDLFLYFVFKNHLLVKYLEIVKNRELMDEYAVLFSENCKKDLQSIELIYPKVETIQSIDILNMTFSYVNGYMNIIMDIEMYFYCDEGSYYNTIFKIEKHFTENYSDNNNSEIKQFNNEMELLERMITGWRIKVIPPLLIKIE